jgi:hypothetical protein
MALRAASLPVISAFHLSSGRTDAGIPEAIVRAVLAATVITL